MVRPLTACHALAWKSIVNRRSLVLLAAVVGFVALLIVVGCLAYQLRRAHVSGRILSKVDRLVLQVPSETTELEWSVRVYWTHNLHCEAMPQIRASIASLTELEKLLDHAIREGPNQRTIDILWNRYGSMSPSGNRYRRTYEPIRDEIAEAIRVQGDNHPTVGDYRGFLMSERATNARRAD